MSEHKFRDPVRNRACTLVVQAGWVGIEHPDCDQYADVAPNLDAFYCQTCRYNGRVSGAWVLDMINQHGGATARDQQRPIAAPPRG